MSLRIRRRRSIVTMEGIACLGYVHRYDLLRWLMAGIGEEIPSILTPGDG